MAKAVVTVTAARERGLPPVSVRSGAVADGYVPVTVANRRVYLPVTQAEFDRVRYLRRRQRGALWGGLACFALGAAMARFPVMLPLAGVIAVLSAVLWGLATMTLRAYLPAVSVDGELLRLRRVHEGFVAAVSADC